MVTRAEVIMAYRLFHGRDPENQEVIANHAIPSRTLEALRRDFLASAEFTAKFDGALRDHASVGHKTHSWPPLRVDVDVDDEQLAQMIARVERQFRHLGETEPHWSVLSSDEFKSAHIASHEEQFFSSGRGVVDELQRTANRCGIDLRRHRACLEFGCGIGRSTIWLADVFGDVLGVDISTAHLALAKRAISRFRKGNVTLRHVNTIDALNALPAFDVLFSIIVLQHNPPPVIALILRRLLAGLAAGGIAYFQLPTYIVGYAFDAAAYLAGRQSLDVPEMHVLGQSELLRIIGEAGCRVLEIREDGAAGFDAVSNRVLVQKL